MKKVALVAVDSPVEKYFSYVIAGDQLESITTGTLVNVPFGKRITHGVVVSIGEGDSEKLKEIAGIYNQLFDLNESEFEFYKWISNYYHYPLGQLIFDTLPKIMKRPRPLQENKGEGLAFEFLPTADQRNAVERIAPSLRNGFSKWLLHGVTGSGKSLVYLELAKKVLESGSSVLFLLPEINLTPQFISIFVKHLDVAVYTYHSEITDSEKISLWKRLKEQSGACLVIGVRSSIFLPFQKLGLIVVDEEHDSSYKQDDRCTYHARDLALKRADLLKIPIVLGSATPSVESMGVFKKENYIELRSRVGGGVLPIISTVDLREEKISEEKWPLSTKSIQKISKALEKGEQVLVFVNRLGFSNSIQCRSCGHQFKCPNCSTNLRFFKRRDELSCFLCDYKEPKASSCPECGNLKLLLNGFGTEKVEAVLQKEFKERVIGRFDRDEIKTMAKLEATLKAFHEKKIDVLVGTQMLSKGHNFRSVNLVVLLGVDAQMNFPDFRATERVYQQITQVSGRAGRFGPQSEVLIETHLPDHPIFELIRSHSFEGFYNEELPIRKICQAPPFSKMAILYITSKFKERAESVSREIALILDTLSKKHFNSVAVLGPRPALVEKRVNKFTQVILLRSSKINELHNAIHSMKKNIAIPSGVTLKLDIDPQQIQ